MIQDRLQEQIESYIKETHGEVMYSLDKHIFALGLAGFLSRLYQPQPVTERLLTPRTMLDMPSSRKRGVLLRSAVDVSKAQDVKTWTFAQQRIKELETLVRDASEWELQDGANVPDDWLNQAQQVIPDIKE